jgi:undecaprenyl-diphosphatase
VHPLALALAVLVAAAVARRWHRLGWLARTVAAVGLSALTVYGAGLIDFPPLDDVLLDVGRALGPWTYLLVGVLAFLETGAFVGLVAPGETAVIAGGVVAGQGEVELGVLLGIVWVCCVGGDCVSFWLGRRLGRQFLIQHGPRVQITEQRIVQVEGFFARHGGATILVGRFIGLVRALAPFIAGASRMSFARFLPFDVVGCGLWASAFTLLGYVSWNNIDRAAHLASQGTFALGTLIAVVVAVVVLRDPERREAVRAWLAEHRRRLLRDNGGRR